MFIKAGQKLSKLYENAVFPDGVVDEGLFDEEHKIPLSAVQWISDQSRGSDDDSAITQDPTDPINTCSQQYLLGFSPSEGGANCLNTKATFIRTSGEAKAASSHRFSTTGLNSNFNCPHCR
ncbi:hypothetical protein FRB95_011531 [Tulasnella sp. JGI-2019a]|nr:hypothetical protein FRB95_011531 [Tulasnella sp. JGI-2019a]